MHTKRPKISIIVPIYNTEKYINKCIESLINQTYQNLEILLIDDGSKDMSPQICDKWGKKDSRIKVIHKINAGASDARNVGINIANGDYIMFVDSDDFIDVTTVSDLYLLLSNTNADIACGGFYKYVNRNSIPIYNHIIQSSSKAFSGIEQLKNMLNSFTDCSPGGKLYKRSSIGDLRFIKGRTNEDVIFLFSFYASCSKVIYTCKRYYYYRDVENSITHTLNNNTMWVLQNMLDMEQMAIDLDLPIKNEMKNYKCRTCLELGYAIQRENARSRFPKQSNYVKKQVKKFFLYMIKHPGYNWRDLVHSLFVLIKL